MSTCSIKFTPSAKVWVQPVVTCCTGSWGARRRVVLLQVCVMTKNLISPPLPQLKGQHQLSNCCPRSMKAECPRSSASGNDSSLNHSGFFLQRALQLSNVLKEIARSEKFTNFDVFYMDFPLKQSKLRFFFSSQNI